MPRSSPPLARSHWLVIPNLRGQGASASLPGPYTPEQLTSDLAGLLRHLGLRQAAVLGYSQGGPIALQLVHDHPDLVGRLILVCSYALNTASRHERFEGRLMPWMFRLRGPRLIAQMTTVANVNGRKSLTEEQADWVLVDDVPNLQISDEDRLGVMVGITIDLPVGAADACSAL